MWSDLVIVLALLQFIYFATLVAKARRIYAIKAPAISGHEVFERHFRVQMNTLEMLVLFVPALWMATKYWPTEYMAVIGAVYLIGRQLYSAAYVKDPTSRGLGFMLSFIPIVILIFSILAGILWTLI